MVERPFDGAINEAVALARSSTRIRLLAELYEEDRLAKATLRERVDGSRTTIQRNLDALEERGWIRGKNPEYRITRTGKPIAKRMLALVETIYMARRFEPFLKWVPSDAFDLDIRKIADADLTVAERSDPYAPVNRHVELMQSTEHFRCMLPAVGLQAMLVARECVLERGHEHEIVVDKEVSETLFSDDNYREPIRDLLDSDRFDLFVASTGVPFCLGIGEDVVHIGVGDDDEVPQCLVESDNPEVREWADRAYGKYHAEAERVTIPKQKSL